MQSEIIAAVVGAVLIGVLSAIWRELRRMWSLLQQIPDLSTKTELTNACNRMQGRIDHLAEQHAHLRDRVSKLEPS